MLERLEVANGLDPRAVGFPAEIVDDELMASSAEVRALDHVAR